MLLCVVCATLLWGVGECGIIQEAGDSHTRTSYRGLFDRPAGELGRELAHQLKEIAPYSRVMSSIFQASQVTCGSQSLFSTGATADTVSFDICLAGLFLLKIFVLASILVAGVEVDRMEGIINVTEALQSLMDDIDNIDWQGTGPEGEPFGEYAKPDVSSISYAAQGMMPTDLEAPKSSNGTLAGGDSTVSTPPFGASMTGFVETLTSRMKEMDILKMLDELDLAGTGPEGEPFENLTPPEDKYPLTDSIGSSLFPSSVRNSLFPSPAGNGLSQEPSGPLQFLDLDAISIPESPIKLNDLQGISVPSDPLKLLHLDDITIPRNPLSDINIEGLPVPSVQPEKIRESVSEAVENLIARVKKINIFEALENMDLAGTGPEGQPLREEQFEPHVLPPVQSTAVHQNTIDDTIHRLEMSRLLLESQGQLKATRHKSTSLESSRLQQLTAGLGPLNRLTAGKTPGLTAGHRAGETQQNDAKLSDNDYLTYTGFGLNGWKSGLQKLILAGLSDLSPELGIGDLTEEEKSATASVIAAEISRFGAQEETTEAAAKMDHIRPGKLTTGNTDGLWPKKATSGQEDANVWSERETFGQNSDHFSPISSSQISDIPDLELYDYLPRGFPDTTSPLQKLLFTALANIHNSKE